ncbi:hypothetical protein [Galbibacter sp.]|uniref:hypothetical protein n=1 Tax=Galbibacter sp. TaxID=2918471 RepID=UPI002CB730B2|nr:hypothetical protein [Galbibacter sp.]HLV63793.1 hypothetical protein [Galbibacter sp.]
MNEENLKYLQNQVFYTGFGDTLDGALKEKLEQQPETFSLEYRTEYGKDKMEAELNFSKSKKQDSDMYFFNSYRATLKREGDSEMAQRFYINKGSNITLKEAYNLMCGRAVNKTLMNKEGELYNAWVQMNFKQADEHGNHKLKHFHENYGYDLGAALSKHPIKELERQEYKDNLMESLKKGNAASATLARDEGGEQKVYVAANPKFKSVTLYDTNMQRMGRMQREKQAKETKQTQKESQSPQGDDESPSTKKKTRRKAKVV